MGTTDGELCGNGLIDVGEECDDWNDEDDDICIHCMNAFCGDGYRLLGVEECDDGNGEDADACHTDCTRNECGDGVPGGDGEECDDGNDVDTDDCLTDCTAASCGDGLVWADMEECDDGDQDPHDACTDMCLNAYCGDGIEHTGVEDCDDGNQSNEDDCTAGCVAAVCGDTYINAGVEDCDDGDVDDYDGCSSDCVEETNCYVFSNQLDCPTGATGYCRVDAADCHSSADALIACQVCMGDGCMIGQATCGDSDAAADPDATCPDANYSFVYGDGTCLAPAVHYECNGGATFGTWCE
jgi:cysteine-rich repeat protein